MEPWVKGGEAFMTGEFWSQTLFQNQQKLKDSIYIYFVVYLLLDIFCDKTLQESQKLPREHLIGFQGVKMFLLKDPFKVTQ